MKPNLTIKFSKKFLKKAGMELFAEEYRRPFLWSIFMYMIDHRTRKIVNIQRWLKQQLKDSENNEEMLKIINNCRKRTDDQTVISLLSWVIDNITYMKDSERYKSPEVWQTPEETLLLKSGDCEDFSILLLCLMRLADIEPNRVQLVAGNVEYNNRVEGHAYLVYLPEEDGVLRALDGTYFASKRRIEIRPPWSEIKYYHKPWFMVNDKRYWGRYYNG